MPTHTRTKTLKTGEGSVASVTSSITKDAAIAFEKIIPAGSTNIEVDVAIDVSQVVSCGLYSDKAISVLTNSSGSPVDTIAVSAKQLIDWQVGDQASLVFTADVTKLFITNAGSEPATVALYVLFDSTPVLD